MNEYMLNYNKIHNHRKKLLRENKTKDCVLIEGSNNVLLSAPHGVSQLRLGKYKVGEIGSMATALALKELTDSSLIVKTKNNNDDANFDEHSPYKEKIYELVQRRNTKFVLDFHGLAADRECDINFGTRLGYNISSNLNIFNRLVEMLQSEGFVVNIDQPFMGGPQTISGATKDKFENTWTLQIEINCAITNNKENIARFDKLVKLFEIWIKYIEAL